MSSLPFPPLSDSLPPFRVVGSASAAARLAKARDMVRDAGPAAQILIIGASRAAADDLARSVAATMPATFGAERFSLTQLAARTTRLALAADRATARRCYRVAFRK